MKWLWAIIPGSLVALALLVEENLKQQEETGIVTRQGFTNGIDVSHNNGPVNWQQVASSGVQFAFIKASEGITLQDPQFSKNVSGAKGAGLRAYAYHFYIPGDDAAAQAQNFLNQINGSGVTAIAVDLESEGGDYILRGSDSDTPNLQNFLDLIAAAGLPIFIYATDGFIQDNYPSAGLSSFQRWNAHYSDTQPETAWVVWQYSPSGQVPGVSGDVDLNYWNGGTLL